MEITLKPKWGWKSGHTGQAWDSKCLIGKLSFAFFPVCGDLACSLISELDRNEKKWKNILIIIPPQNNHYTHDNSTCL